MPNELKDLKLNEVSIVDEPANKGARVVLLKRAGAADERGNMSADESAGFLTKLARMLKFNVSRQEGGSLIIKTEDDVPDEKIQKQLDELTAQVTKISGERDAAVAVNAATSAIAKAETPEAVDEIVSKAAEAVRSSIKDAADARKVAIKSAQAVSVMKGFRDKLPKSMQKAFDDMDEKDREEFMGSYKKSAADPVAKALDAATARADKLEDEVAKLRESDEIRSAREELKDLSGVVKLDEFAPRIVKMRKTDKAGADAIVADFRAIAKQAKDGGLFKVLGRDGAANPDGAEAKIEKAAKKYQGDHPGVTHAVAVTKVLEADPTLYTEHVNESPQTTQASA